MTQYSTSKPRTTIARALAALLLAPIALMAISGSAVAAGPGLILAIDLGDPDLRDGLVDAGIPQCNGTNSPYCFDFVSAIALTTLDFQGRQAMIVGWTNTVLSAEFAALQAKAPWVETFVDGGGGLIAFYEGQVDRYLWLPDGAQFTSASTGGETLILTSAGATHPSHAGQTSGSLSNWVNSYHGIITSFPSYLTHTLVTNTAGQPVTLAGPYGQGCILVSGMDPDWHADNGNQAARDLLRSEVDWAIRCGCHAGEPCEPRMTLEGRTLVRESEVRPDQFDPLPALIPLEGERDHDHEHPETGDVWTYVGPVRVDVDFCECEIVGFRVLYTTINDVPPFEPDFMTPLTAQTDYNTWVVSIPDGDTYEITFTVYLDCPDGRKEVTLVWNQLG